MSISHLTKGIQRIVNVKIDGVYGPKTAQAVLDKFGLSSKAGILSNKTRAIQRHVGAYVDGIYGPKTAQAILDKLSNKTDPEIVVGSDKFTEKFRQTPNISARRIRPLGIVLHHSAGSFNGSVSWCMNPASKVSYHVLINRDGSRVRLAEDNHRTWHAGTSSFKGRSNCNDFMIGVSVSENTNTRELTNAEVESICEYIIPRIKKHSWPRDLSTITTHRFISPGRKDDVDVRAEKRVLNRLRELLG